MTFTDARAGTEPDAIAPDGAGVFFLSQLESAEAVEGPWVATGARS